MKIGLSISTVLLFLFPSLLSAQDLSGYWLGILPQSDKGFVFIARAHIHQEGSQLEGIIRYDNPTNTEFVEESFTGFIRGQKVSLFEQEVTDSHMDDPYLFGWCLKILLGQVRTDSSRGCMILAGNWTSERVWVQFEDEVVEGFCAPGTFYLVKVLSGTTSGLQ